MKKLEDIKPSLPLTFQKAITKKNIKPNFEKKIAVKHIGTEAKSTTRFYRPISKIITI